MVVVRKIQEEFLVVQVGMLEVLILVESMICGVILIGVSWVVQPELVKVVV